MINWEELEKTWQRLMKSFRQVSPEINDDGVCEIFEKVKEPHSWESVGKFNVFDLIKEALKYRNAEHYKDQRQDD